MILFIVDNVDGDITKGKTMDSTKLTQLVKDVVADFIADEKLFSAYDITKTLRSDGNDVRHFEVKDIVHGLFANYEMDTQMIRTGKRLSGGRWTLVYHLNWQDVSNYDPNDVAEVAKVTDDGTSGQDRDSYSDTQDRDSYDVDVDEEDEEDDDVVDVSYVDATINDDHITLYKDNRRRVCIPAEKLRTIGAYVGEVVYALPTADKISITQTDTVNSHPYIVDKDNNVRIGNLVLNKAGLGSVDEVDCAVRCGDIVIIR